MSSGYRPALIALAAVIAGGVALDAHMRHAGLTSLHYERTAVASVLGTPIARATLATAAASAQTALGERPVLLASTQGAPGLAVATAPAPSAAPISAPASANVPTSANAPSPPAATTTAPVPPGIARRGLLTLLQVDEGPPPVSRAQARAAEQRAAREHVLRVCADPNNLPFSNRRGEGFENAIARLIAHDLGRTVRYTWFTQRRGFIRNTLNAARCDVVMSVPASYGLVRATRPYYRSTYVFVSRRDRHVRITSIDDPRLAHMTIGLPTTGDGMAPAAEALALRGLMYHTRVYSLLGDVSKPYPARALIDAVARGEVDVGIDWGPRAGYFARRERIPLVIEPVPPPREMPSLEMSFPISMGVRHGDRALEATLDRTLVRCRGEIQRVLTSYGVPLVGADGRLLVVANRSTG